MKLRQKLAIWFLILQLKFIALFSKRRAAKKALQVFRTPVRRSKKLPTALFLAAENLEFNFNGTIIRGYRWNYPAKRKALVLHGHESSVLNFEVYIKGLMNKGYEVLAFDAPAHGLSDGQHIDALDYRNFIIYINEKFGPVQSYMGHSFGGLAVSLAMEKITHDDTYRLALIAPATETSTTLDRYFKFLKLSDKKLQAYFEDLIIEIGGHPSGWYSVKRAMAHIKAGVIWAHDENDDVTPIEDALKVKEQNYPNIKFVLTKGLGHKKIYRDEKVVKAIIDFL